MPHRLKERQKKIQDKRKQTPWREFVMEIGSRLPLTFYANGGYVSRYPSSDRHGKIVSVDDFHGSEQDVFLDHYDDPFSAFSSLFVSSAWSHIFDYGGSENALYADLVFQSQNCYLSNTVINGCDKVLYSYNIKDQSHDILDSVLVWKSSQYVARSLSIISSRNVFYSSFIENSSDIWFSVNLNGCEECLFCSNLQNKKFHIKNKELTKEEYYMKKKDILSRVSEFDGRYEKFIYPKKGPNTGSDNASGGNALFCSDVENAYNCFRVVRGRNVVNVGGGEISDAYDVLSAGAGAGCADAYAVFGTGIGSSHTYLSANLNGGSHIYYSMNMVGCSYCLDCIGLKNKSYCIFNKQYAKEERYNKVDEIFSQMEKDGDLGKFFPGSMNPFYFNDTAAYLIDDTFTKEEVEAKGYMRRDEPIQVDIPAGAKVVKTIELDQYEGFDDAGQWSIDPEILKVIIQDEEGNVYRIVQMEYDFLIKHGLPLPRKHWLERMKENFRVG